MALCRTCHTVIPCHCHITPPTQIRPGVYLAATRPGFEDDALHFPIDGEIVISFETEEPTP